MPRWQRDAAGRRGRLSRMPALGNLDWAEAAAIVLAATLFFGGSAIERILELLQRRRRH